MSKVSSAKAVEVDSMIQHYATEAAKYERVAEQQNEIAKHSNRAERVAKAEAAALEADAMASQMNKLCSEWADQYKGWERYYLVVSSDGHVHSSTRCSSCNYRTAFAWLTEYSGMSADDLVKLAGERACTVCFADAPVSTDQSMLAVDVKSREEKEAAAAERDAKRAKAAAATVTVGRKVFKTVRGAENEVGWLVDCMVSSRYMNAQDMDHRNQLNANAAESEAKAREIAAALAEQHGVNVEELLAKKFAAKVKEHRKYDHYSIPFDAKM